MTSGGHNCNDFPELSLKHFLENPVTKVCAA